MGISDPFTVGWDGIKEPLIAAMNHGGLVAADVGKVCNVTNEMTMSVGGNGDEIQGQIASIDSDKIGGMKIDGVFEFEYSGADPGYGRRILSSDASGKVKVNTAGTLVIVISQDTTKKLVRFIKGEKV
ncbi:MAG: hypothetical protein HS129_15090 [Leptospiraceae bacterium]|nr:hypothetical protein [Leptospiraceae bacterium]